MALVIVPDCIADQINAKLDAAIATEPEAAKDREHLYSQLLAYFDKFGTVPEFALEKVQRVTCIGTVIGHKAEK